MRLTLTNVSAALDWVFQLPREDAAMSYAPSTGDRPRTSTGGPLEPPPRMPPAPAAEPGSYEERGTTYRSVTAFIAERLLRLRSRERDVGTRWRDGDAIYRAAWIEDTGELYLVQLGPAERGGGHVELLAAGIDGDELERAFAGWLVAQDSGERSLDWLGERVRRLAEVVEHRRRGGVRSRVSTTHVPLRAA